MSVTSAMYTGVSGLINNGEAMNVIGNNISNVNTIGFKTGRTLFSDMLSSSIGNNSQIGRGVQIQKVDNVFGQGSLESTSSVTDLAIQGDGFFALGAPNSSGTATPTSAYYTRAGSFRLDSTGLGLVNPDNYKVLDTAGNAITFPPTCTDTNNNTLNFQKVTGVDSNGAISLLYSDANGNTATVYYAGSGAVDPAYANAVKIAEVNIPNPPGMTKQGGTLFSLTTDSGTPAAPASGVFASANGTSDKVLSNSLELSNVDMSTEFVNMITTQRAYSANSKTITTVDQMTQDVLNMIR